MESVGQDVRRLCNVAPAPVEWLWEPYLACGSLALLSGEPGSGTTFLALAIAAGITRERTFSVSRFSFPVENRTADWSGALMSADQEHQSPNFRGRDTGELTADSSQLTATQKPGHALYLCWEDNAARMVRPRFESLGGDPDRMGVARGYWDPDLLGVAIREIEPRLVIIDTIQTFAEIWRRTRWLDELRRLALECECCILLIRHITRPRTGRAPARRLGNFDMSSAVSSELLIGNAVSRLPSPVPRCATQEMQGGQGERRLVQLRSSLGPVGESLGFCIDAAGSFRWTGPAEVDAGELLAPPGCGEQQSALAEAIEFLRTTLQEQGALSYGEIQKMARQAGISQASLQRAKYRLGVVCRKQQGSGCWCWSLEVSKTHHRGTETQRKTTLAEGAVSESLLERPSAAEAAGNIGACGATESAPSRRGHEGSQPLREEGIAAGESVAQVEQLEEVEQVDVAEQVDAVTPQHAKTGRVGDPVGGEWPVAAVPWVMMDAVVGGRSPAVPGRGG